MSNICTEAQLFALFAKKHHLINRTPSAIQDFYMNFNHENIICTPKDQLARIFSVDKGVSPDNISIKVFGKDRGAAEFSGDDIQIICAACIHDESNVILLSLNHDAPYVDGYLKGTLSYPQGHCKYDVEIAHACNNDEINLGTLISKIRTETLREVTEEIGSEDPVLQQQFYKDLQDRLLHPAGETVHMIYIDRPGSTEKHLCMLFDVDMSGTCFEKMADQIVSNEPEKHDVIIANYEKLVELDRVDIICPWVAKSFSTLHFYQTTFLKNYLEKMRRRSAF